MNQSNLRELETLFLALGDKTRLRLLALMAKGEVPVGFLVEKLGESQPKVSRHLAYLRNSGVVYTRRNGKWIYYGIDYPKDRSLGGMLRTVVDSIVEAGEAGRVYAVESEGEDIEAGVGESDIYAQANITVEFDETALNDIYGQTDIFEENTVAGTPPESGEMDVFLL